MGKRVCSIDVEMTGLRVHDRIVSFAAWEIKGDTVTGNHVSVMVNPQHNISRGAEKIHRISNKEAETFPLFTEVAPSVLKFIGDSQLVMHCPLNAHRGMATDEYYLNREFELAGLPLLPADRFINTNPMSRAIFDINSLDNLLDHYNVSRKERQKYGHSAKLDAKLLGKIYPRLRDDFEATLKYREGAFDAKAEETNSQFADFFRAVGMAP